MKTGRVGNLDIAGIVISDRPLDIGMKGRTQAINQAVAFLAFIDFLNKFSPGNNSGLEFQFFAILAMVSQGKIQISINRAVKGFVHLSWQPVNRFGKNFRTKLEEHIADIVAAG